MGHHRGNNAFRAARSGVRARNRSRTDRNEPRSCQTKTTRDIPHGKPHRAIPSAAHAWTETGNGSTWAAMTRTRQTSGRSGKRSPKSPTYSRIATAIRNTKRSPPSKGRLSGSPRVPLAASIEPRPVRTAFPAGSRFGRFRGLAVATARSHAVRWLCLNPPSSRVRPGAEAAPKPPANTPANPRRVTAPSMPRATEPSPTARLIA